MSHLGSLLIAAALAVVVTDGHRTTSGGDLLELGRSRTGDTLPPGWSQRAVRGATSPTSVVSGAGSDAACEIRGTGKAAWYYRDLRDLPVTTPSAFTIRYRLLTSPDAADLSEPTRSDAALRVYIVLEEPRRILPRHRLLFYSRGHTSRGEHVAHPRRDICDLQRTVTAGECWREERLDPLRDIIARCEWNAWRMVAIGIMQDTEQTHGTAVAQITTLRFHD